MTPTLAAAVIQSSTSNAAGATTRATYDKRGKFGGVLTLKVTNGGTGPTVQCEARVLVAHNDGTTPAAAAAGADWKTIARFGNGTAANTVGEWMIEIPDAVQHFEVEFTGNTGQAVTVEANYSGVSSIA